MASEGVEKVLGAYSSLPPNLVFDANDIVLAKIGAGLHLYQFEIDLAGVGKAVDRAQRDLDALVFAERFGLVTHLHFGRPPHDHPVLCAVKVFLKAQSLTRFDKEVFDLEPLANEDGRIPAPRAIARLVGLG